MGTCLNLFVIALLYPCIPKPFKDPTLSDSYSPITLPSNLSKVLERCILSQFGYCVVTSELQFGFKPGFSTDLCTGVSRMLGPNTFIMDLVRSAVF